MNANTQRSLNAGWTRHQNTRPAPQVRPVSILTRAGELVTGTAWVQGRTVSYDRLMEHIAAAIKSYKAGDAGAVLYAVLVQPAPGAVCIPVRIIDMKQVTPVVE